MKYTILAATAALCLGTAYGASINASNLAGVNGNAVITDNAGAPISEVFSFLSTDAQLAGVMDFASLQALGGSLSILDPTGNQFRGVPNTDGVFSNGYNGAGGTGEAIFVIFSDNADLSQAGLLGLVNTGQTLDPDGASPDSNNYVMAPGIGTVQLGAFGGPVTADWASAVGGPNTGPSFALATPEPTSSLLAGLAGLAFLIRRKR